MNVNTAIGEDAPVAIDVTDAGFACDYVLQSFGDRRGGHGSSLSEALSNRSVKQCGVPHKKRNLSL
jgi:hypothetical protein